MMKGRLRLSYLLIMYLVFVIAVGVSLKAGEAAEKTEEWVRLYDGPGNGPDFANAITVDSLGNILVTGRCQISSINADYGTIKYDPNGTQLWAKTYDGPGNSVDFAKDITVDSLGNVYVTGEIYSSGTSGDYATIKYASNGTKLWEKTYDSLFNEWDSANAITSDSSGNVYVTGWSANDYTTIKYDTDSTLIWEAIYDGPIASTDKANAIAIDSFGNVVVTGESIGIGTNYDYATIKYDIDGNQVWVRRYNGPVNNIDKATAIAIDSSNNVYVTGESIGIGTNYDYATIKYDIDGNQVWVRRYDGPVNSADKASAIAIDSSSNVYVTGESVGSGTNSDYATIKYDTNGNEVWFARYNGPGNDTDKANAIAIDSADNIFVTGESISSGINFDYATLKYAGEEEENEVIMEIPAGWSMISIPVLPDNAALSNLFNDAVVVYKFLKTMGYVRLEENDNFEVGTGYWILLNTQNSYTIRGLEITDYTLPVEDGWYMIGGCTSSAQKFIENGTVIVVYGFDQNMGYIRIEDEETLEPGIGYWILFSDTTVDAEFTASTF